MTADRIADALKAKEVLADVVRSSRCTGPIKSHANTALYALERVIVHLRASPPVDRQGWDVEKMKAWFHDLYGNLHEPLRSECAEQTSRLFINTFSLPAQTRAVTLTEDERKLVDDFKQAQRDYPNASFASKWHSGLLAIIDRLAPPQPTAEP